MQATRPSVPTATWIALAAAAAVVVLGVAFRLVTRSDLWLDEALSVNIARLPIGDLFRQLRHDGHPPLYYLLLHGWMEVAGDGDNAVRLLSSAFGLATLPAIWVAARRYGGQVAALAAVVLLATSPFAVRYATETRMYSLAMLLVILGWLALQAVLERPTFLRMTAVAVISGLLALTHYWSLYLLAATGLLLLWLWRRGRPTALRAAIALVAGGILFLPWLPAFLDQSAHTGTPWGRPERPSNVLAISFTDWGGGPNGEAQMLGAALALLIILALFGRAVNRRHIELDLRTRPEARAETAVAFAAVAIAVAAGYATGSAFASRYTAVVFPLVVLLAALGVRTFADRRVRAGILVLVALLGLIGCWRNFRAQRTQAGQIAAYVAEYGSPGDLVAFCPDQLGPAVTRYLPDGYDALTFPEAGDPTLVDWVDYEDRMTAGRPKAFAQLLHERAGDRTIWLVWAPGYRTLRHKCELTAQHLEIIRPSGKAVVGSGGEFEHAWLYQYGAG